MEVELTDHLGYEPTRSRRVVRATPERVDVEDAADRARAVGIDTPRDRAGTLSRRSCASVSGVSKVRRQDPRAV